MQSSLAGWADGDATIFVACGTTPITFNFTLAPAPGYVCGCCVGSPMPATLYLTDRWGTHSMNFLPGGWVSEVESVGEEMGTILYCPETTNVYMIREPQPVGVKYHLLCSNSTWMLRRDYFRYTVQATCPGDDRSEPYRRTRMTRDDSTYGHGRASHVGDIYYAEQGPCAPINLTFDLADPLGTIDADYPVTITE